MAWEADWWDEEQKETDDKQKKPYEKMADDYKPSEKMAPHYERARQKLAAIQAQKRGPLKVTFEDWRSQSKAMEESERTIEVVAAKKRPRQRASSTTQVHDCDDA